MGKRGEDGEERKRERNVMLSKLNSISLKETTEAPAMRRKQKFVSTRERSYEEERPKEVSRLWVEIIGLHHIECISALADRFLSKGTHHLKL